MNGNGQVLSAVRPGWGYGQDRPHVMVEAALRTVAREGFLLQPLPAALGLPCRWARAIAECLARGDCRGGVVFCEDPGLVACVANKVSGLRAVPVATVAQATRATATLAANLLVVEMPGRTFYEVRQILRLLCTSPAHCPDGVACTLEELDGHAHRGGDRQRDAQPGASSARRGAVVDRRPFQPGGIESRSGGW